MASVNLGKVGLLLRGDWDSDTDYAALDVVSHEGYAYAARVANKNVEPSAETAAYWQPLAESASVLATMLGYKNDAADSATAAAGSATAAATSASSATDALANEAADFSSSKAYAIGDYVIYNNGTHKYLYRFTAAHSAGAWIGTDATQVALADDVGDLKSALRTVNELDLIAGGNRTNKTVNTVDFTWNADKTACTVNGTNPSSKRLEVNSFLGSSTTIPDGFTPGETYFVFANSTSEQVILGFYFYVNGTYSSSKTFSSDGTLTIPSNTTGMLVFIGLRPGQTANNDVISGMSVQKNNYVKDISELKNALDYPYGVLPTNTDADNITENGIWWVSSSNSYTNLPDGMTNGILISRMPYTTSTNIRFQMAYSNNDGKIYYRYRISSGWVSGWKNGNDFIVPYGETHTQTSISRVMSVSKAIAQGDRIAVKITKWTGPTPSAINFYAKDGSTNILKVTVSKVGQWLEFVADQEYDGYMIGMQTENPLSEAATLEFIESPYYQSQYITESTPGAPVVYGKKILLGGASIVAGYGGTGYAMDGDVIIDISDTAEGQAYSTGGLWKRNTSGYCWANLFKTLCEGQYNATVDNNGCAGVSVSFWARHADVLIPDDGYDLFIYTFGSNDRNVIPSTARTNIRSGLKTLLDRCQELGIEMLVVSVPPASQANEEGKLTQTWQCNEFIKEACAEFGVRYFDLHDELIKYYWNHGAESAGTYISDGLDPDDAMYYVMYFCYCWLLDVSPMTAYQQPPT